MFVRACLIMVLLLGCGTTVDQTRACAEWVGCIDARDEQLGVETDNVRFEAGGPCWDNPEIAHLCDTACDAGMVQMRELYSDLPEACL